MLGSRSALVVCVGGLLWGERSCDIQHYVASGKLFSRHWQSQVQCLHLQNALYACVCLEHVMYMHVCCCRCGSWCQQRCRSP
jgi:hypothetical protein